MKRSLLRIAALAACLFGLAGNVNMAAADGSYDESCSVGFNQGGCTVPHYIGANGGRCDVTIKFLGGAASALIAHFWSGVYGDLPWSPWLRVNDTWSRAEFGNDWGAANVASSQDGRAANYRVRWTGACWYSW